MPKYGGTTYIDQLSFTCDPELREKLLALGYLRGDAGSYAPIARNIMRRAVDETIAQLDPQELKDFKKILESVKTKTVVSRMERQLREQGRKRNGPPLYGKDSEL